MEIELEKLLPVFVIPEAEVSTEASLYETMYRKYGIRNIGRLGSPVVSPDSEWDMTKHAVLHYVPTHEKDYGMADNYPLLNGWNKYIYVEHILEVTQQLGNPRTKLFNSKLAIRAYRKMYPTLKWCRDVKHFESLKDNPSVLLVVNYGMTGRNLRYRPIPMIEVMKWSNQRDTVWKTVESIAVITDRQQFLEFEPPRSLPTKMELDRSSEELKRIHMKLFDDNQKLDLLDFWRWMNPNTRKLSKMSAVSDKHLQLVNFIFRVGGNFVVLNLGRLNEWILGHGIEEIELENDEDEDQIDEGTSYIQMQKRMLKFFKLLNEFRKDENTQVVVTDTNKQIEYHIENEIDVDISDDEDEEVKETKSVILPDKKDENVQINPETQEVTTVAAPIAPVDNVIVEKDKETGKVVVTYLNPIKRTEIALRKDKLLQQIEGNHAENVKLFSKMRDEDTIVQKVLKKDVVENVETPPHEEDNLPMKSAVEVKYTTNIREQASKLVKSAIVTQGEMKRIEGMANAFKRIKDPYGSGRTLEEVVSEELAVVDEVPEKEIPDIPIVTDKTMLKSRNIDFDKRYIKQVMPRDTARAVLSVQKAGVAVTSYEKEDLIDAGNRFERHSIQVTPVGGATSTIHVKIPKIDENGHMLVAGTKYLIKKQRVDKQKKDYMKLFIW